MTGEIWAAYVFNAQKSLFFFFSPAVLRIHPNPQRIWLVLYPLQQLSMNSLVMDN